MENPVMMNRDASWALLTDLYELTMAFGYWRLGMAEREAVFYLSYRENPFEGRYCVACGLAHLAEFLDAFHFSAEDLDYLRSLTGADGKPLFEEGFLRYLSGMRLTCDLDAVEEGRVVFPQQPLLRVRGPLSQAQLLESLLLNTVNFPTLVATKAARICHAAGDGRVLEFGLRRAQGESGALVASRAAYVGGCEATSNVLAGKLYGIPVRGTHAHSWVMSFDDELSAFEAYARVMPNNCIFVVDTYDSRQGIVHAIQVAQQLGRQGHALLGIRLDSGDLVALSRLARQMLDEAQLPDVAIVASNDLDEYAIAQLRQQGARIDIWGVGTRLATAYDQPALGGVYKLSALRTNEGDWEYKMKVSDQPLKASLPGILQVRRYAQAGKLAGDLIYDDSLGVADPDSATPIGGANWSVRQEAAGSDLLVSVYRAGHRVYEFPSIHEVRSRCRAEVAAFHDTWADEEFGGEYPVAVAGELWQRRAHMMDTLGKDRSCS
jgi:nicotinate phosphoribosyltransferase